MQKHRHICYKGERLRHSAESARFKGMHWLLGSRGGASLCVYDTRPKVRDSKVCTGSSGAEAKRPFASTTLGRKWPIQRYALGAARAAADVRFPWLAYEPPLAVSE